MAINVPNNGFVAVKPCGCYAAWATEADDKEIPDWLRAGYTVRPVPPGEKITAVRCEEHNATT